MKLSGTPDEPSAICTWLCGSLPIRSIGIAIAVEERGDVLRAVANGNAVDLQRLVLCSS